MNTSGKLIASFSALILVVLVWLSVHEASQLRASLYAWFAVAIATVLLATSSRIIPGGPFISTSANIVPAMSCMVLMISSAQRARTASPGSRLSSVCLFLFAIGVVLLVAWDITSFRSIQGARGQLIGW